MGLADVLSFLGEFNDALRVVLEAQKTHKDFAEVEYRLVGLFFVLNKEKYALTHLISAMKIDYDYHTILNELYPIAYENTKIQKLLTAYKKATE
jgi:hypothetical protein